MKSRNVGNITKEIRIKTKGDKTFINFPENLVNLAMSLGFVELSAKEIFGFSGCF